MIRPIGLALGLAGFAPAWTPGSPDGARANAFDAAAAVAARDQHCGSCTVPMSADELDLLEYMASELAKLSDEACKQAGLGLQDGSYWIEGTSDTPWYDNGDLWVGNADPTTGAINYARGHPGGEPFSLYEVGEIILHEALHIYLGSGYPEHLTEWQTSYCLGLIPL